MAGSLIQVDTETVTSNVSSVSLTGVSTNDVYMIACSNIFFDSNDDMKIRFTVSGSADTSSNYDYAHRAMYNNATMGSTGAENQSSLDTNQSTGTSGTNSINLIMYLFNFNNSSEYSFVTYNNVHRASSNTRTGFFAGGGLLTEAQTTDGVHFFLGSGNNFANGTFTLYKIQS